MKPLCALLALGFAVGPPSLAAATPLFASSAGGARRFALVVGANRGGTERPPLRYAIDDADRFASLVVRMGGVEPGDRVVLREPTRQVLLDALAATRDRAAEVNTSATRTEVLVYFSGHADERGLLLGRETVTYRELRQAIAAIPADVGITILDACASGAITRLKGGRPSPAFLTDESVQVQGYAFLTSSSENEAAQEAEHLKGSFFTHALLTGLRGAADVSGDGKVTLGEAYQFAFAETLVKTATTQAGAQHPAYDIKMAGTGDVVMTDVRDNSASLILGPEFDGHFLVMDAQRRLVAELTKPAGRRVELGLEPGQYQVYFEQERALLTGTLRLVDGQRQELERDSLVTADRMPTGRRGPEEKEEGQDRDNLDGRWRIAFQGGITNTSVTTTAAVTRVDGAGGGTQFSTWVRPDLSVDLRIQAIDVDVVATSYKATTGTDIGFLVGSRYHLPMAGAFRPHAGASIGVFTQEGTVAVGDDFARTDIDGTRLGGTLEAGVDFRIGGHFFFNVEGIYTMRDDRPDRFDLVLGLGFIFGSGRR